MRKSKEPEFYEVSGFHCHNCSQTWKAFRELEARSDQDQITIGLLRRSTDRLGRQIALLRAEGTLGPIRPPGNPPDHIYIIGRPGDEHLKIGISNDPQQRCRTLSNGPDQDLRVLFQENVGSDRARRIERHCHHMLRARRAEAGYGREWFRIELEGALRYVRAAILSVKD